eukprot:5248036-Heterocapsa_arctica.AAC.1
MTFKAAEAAEIFNNCNNNKDFKEKGKEIESDRSSIIAKIQKDFKEKGKELESEQKDEAVVADQ